MCLDKRAMRSYAAWKGWQTRRAKAPGPFRVGAGMVQAKPANLDNTRRNGNASVSHDGYETPI
jgi:hypothetical protein